VKGRTSWFLCIYLIMQIIACVSLVAAADTVPVQERNRITLEKVPAFALSINTRVDILEGVLGRELWRVNIQPTLAAEIAFAGGLSAGVSLPFTLQTGYPFYDAGSFGGEIGPFRLGIDFSSSSGALSYRVGISFTPQDRSTNPREAIASAPAAGGSASIACIRDPVALKFDAEAEAAPAPDTGKWHLRGVGGGAAVLAVLNELISIELGVIVHLHLNRITGSPPPSIIGRTGLYIRTDPFIASLFASRDLWNPAYPASVGAGIGISWGM
jgi:hypothetical protein